MTTYIPLPIPPTALKELRGTDDAGRPAEPFTARADGVPLDCVGSLLRCCLRDIRAGERVALVSYAPLRRWAAGTGARPGAYEETGPVFLHAEDCADPEATATAEGYPATARRAAHRAPLRRRRAHHRRPTLEIPEDAAAGFDAAFDEAFADPEVALVHVRAVEYGCFLFEVRRA